MSIDVEVNLSEYTQQQYKHIMDLHKQYEKGNNTQCTPAWYIEHVYIPQGYASKFHQEFMEKLKHDE